MQGIIEGNAAQIGSGQAARNSTELQATAINSAASAINSGAKAAAKAAATLVVQKVVKPENK